MAQLVKDPPADAGDARDVRSIPEQVRSPGGGHGNSLRYSCLENPIDRGAWWGPVTQSLTVVQPLKILCLGVEMVLSWCQLLAAGFWWIVMKKQVSAELFSSVSFLKGIQSWKIPYLQVEVDTFGCQLPCRLPDFIQCYYFTCGPGRLGDRETQLCCSLPL